MAFWHTPCRLIGKRKEKAVMAYVISEKCTKCGSCAPVCPQEAIAEGDKRYVIDPEKCVDCGLCAGECPVEAISPE
jgi:ferredoxin